MPPPPLPRTRVRTLATETAHERHSRLFRTAQEAYSHGRAPPRPRTKQDLDVLKERNQFIRDTDQDPASLGWEDALALKYYQTLFREYAVVNLKHYKTGAIALRWRTETEVLSGVAHLTCASLRCPFHLPSTSDEPDPEATDPLVPTPLDEFEVPFSYVEDDEKKSALVKVVLCPDCGRKLLYGREKKRKEERRREKEDAETGEWTPELPPEMRGTVVGPSRRSASPPARRPRG